MLWSRFPKGNENRFGLNEVVEGLRGYDMPLVAIKRPDGLCLVGVQDGAASLQVFCELGFKGQAIQPLIDGCRESNFSREWLTGETV